MLAHVAGSASAKTTSAAREGCARSRPRLGTIACLALFAVGASGAAQGLRPVASDLPGGPLDRPHLRYGGVFEYPADMPGLGPNDSRRVLFGDEVAFGYGGLDPAADYQVRLEFLAD